MKTITEYDRGYWIAVQNVASFDLQPDKQAVKALIRDAGFDRDRDQTVVGGFQSRFQERA